MSLIDAVQTIGIIGSLLFGAWQFRATRIQNKANHLERWIEKLDELIRLSYDNPEIIKELDKPYDPAKAKYEKAFYLLGLSLNTFEQVYFQYKKFKNIEEGDWERIAPIFLSYIDTPYGRGFWETVGGFAETTDDDFIAYYSALLASA